jgi:TatD DNase family protein
MEQVVRLYAAPECTAAHGDEIFVNITNRANYRSPFITNSSGVVRDAHSVFLREREPTIGEVLDAIGTPASWRVVVFAGVGEPTLRLYDMLEIARRVHERGGMVRLETDGLANLVFGRDITPDLEGSVDTLFVALNAHDAATYDRVSPTGVPGAYDAVLAFARNAAHFVESVVLTAVNDVNGVDLAGCQEQADRLGLPLLILPHQPAPR